MQPLDFTIHGFTNAPAGKSFSSNEYSWLQSGNDILNKTVAKHWQNPCHTKFHKFPLNVNKASFQYLHKPPGVQRKEKHTPLILKDWGTPVDKDEIFRLQELLEFQSTDFTRSKENKARSSEDLPPPKRRKVDEASLHELIPQPHFLPPPMREFKRQLPIGPYKKRKPIMIPPYSLPLNGLSEWDNYTWIIPVRGRLPWQGSTPASLLESNSDKPSPPTEQMDDILWSHKALLNFWTFLLGLREAGTFGPLGLSFHPTILISSQNPDILVVTGTSSSLESPATKDNALRTSSGQPASVGFLDYIKIYHEWGKSLQLRNILDIWRYELDGEKIRILVGAKLVLLDNKSQGVLIL